MDLFDKIQTERDTLQSRMFKLMASDPEKYCKDDVHAVEIEMMEKETGLVMTRDQIRTLANIVRSRRSVLVKNPHLDRRSATIPIEEETTRYFGGVDTL